MSPFQAPAIVTSISYTKDGGVRIGFTTNELTDEEKLVITKHYQQFGYLLFKPNEFQQEDIPSEDIEDTTKTPSKRLRAALFVLWKQIGSKENFETWYRIKMDSIIEQVKSKLD